MGTRRAASHGRLAWREGAAVSPHPWRPILMLILFAALALPGCAHKAYPLKLVYHSPNLPDMWPLAPEFREVISRFGDSRGRRSHKGIDIRTPKGALVFAAADGVVVFAGKLGGYGKVVMVNHGPGVQTVYAHLKSVSVRAGEEIRRGNRVGRTGKSGNASTPHLHYEVHQGGRAVNPEPYLPMGKLSGTRGN